MTQAPLAQALKTATLVYDREVLLAAIARMGQEISRDMRDTQPVFITVMNGALIFAGHLAIAMTTDCEFDYLHATRYRGETSGGKLHWYAEPRVALAGRDVLLVDDILDEGHTLAEVRDHCRAAGAKSVRIAVLCQKKHDRCVSGLVADYIGVDVPDKYVFGFGMDYHEQGRNLPAIYAL
jgi:hypoxanthine phosphoribosyltransferase